MNKILPQSQIEAILTDLGMTPKAVRIGAAIALCETPVYVEIGEEPKADFCRIGDQALADETWGPSYGGFQVRSLWVQQGTGKIRDSDLLLRPHFNCRSAMAIKRMWGGWGAWSTFNDDQYKAYLQDLFPPPPGVYVVTAGNTLEKIAAAISTGWSWQDLADANELNYPYTIYIGQHLKLP